ERFARLSERDARLFDSPLAGKPLCKRGNFVLGHWFIAGQPRHVGRKRLTCGSPLTFGLGDCLLAVHDAVADGRQVVGSSADFGELHVDRAYARLLMSYLVAQAGDLEVDFRNSLLGVAARV